MDSPACKPAKPCTLQGCTADANTHVCVDMKAAAQRNNDWEACPYQMPGNWRWIPTIGSDGVATKCSPPPEDTKGYTTEMYYKSAEWQACTN